MMFKGRRGLAAFFFARIFMAPSSAFCFHPAIPMSASGRVLVSLIALAYAAFESVSRHATTSELR